MSVWNIFRIGASALNAQRTRLDAISNNIANAETTHTEAGGPYQRRDVVFTPDGQKPFEFHINRLRGRTNVTAVGGQKGVKVDAIVLNDEPGPQVYDPTHPDANEEGFVQYPNVNMVVEMTNMMSATRSYEAGLTVVEAAKRIALKALEIGRA